MMMPFKRQALVEFSELQSADRCVSCGAKEPVYIAGVTSVLTFPLHMLTPHWFFSRVPLSLRPTGLL